MAPPRFLLFGLVFAAGIFWLLEPYGEATAVLLGFDVAALLFLLSVLPFLRNHSPADIKRHAAANDANRAMLLAITAATMTAILTATFVQLDSSVTPASKVLVVVTLVLAWLFSNSVYALHYAHLYYGGSQSGGLSFKGPKQPDYGDFVYFAFTLGMTFQTSDVDITTPAMRRSVTLHCLAAFFFNLGVVAFTINVLGGR